MTLHSRVESIFPPSPFVGDVENSALRSSVQMVLFRRHPHRSRRAVPDMGPQPNLRGCQECVRSVLSLGKFGARWMPDPTRRVCVVWDFGEAGSWDTAHRWHWLGDMRAEEFPWFGVALAKSRVFGLYRIVCLFINILVCWFIYLSRQDFDQKHGKEHWV